MKHVKARTDKGVEEVYVLGSGFGVAWYPEIEVDDDELDAVVTLKLGVEADRLVIARFTAERRPGGRPITIETLKSMPMVALTAASGHDFGPNTGGLVRLRPGADGGLVIQASADVQDLEELPEIERAALVYRWGYLLGLPPTVTVAETLGLTRAVAAKRVQAARRAGLLDPTTRGRKGA